MTPSQDSQGRYIAPGESRTAADVVTAPTEVDTTMWEEQTAVTGRPNDIGPDGPPANSTFAERAAARNKQQKTETAKDSGEPEPARKQPRRRKAS